jgi:hypothetical protein
VAKGQLTLIYITNSKDGRKVQTFEKAIFKNEPIGIALKLFRCLKIDLARDKHAKGIYGDKVPQFIAFDAKGERVDEVYMRDYKCKTDPLMRLLVKTSKGHGKLPLKSFVKKYRGFLNELDRLEGKKTVLAQKKQRLLGGAKKGQKPGQKPAPKKKISKRTQKKLDKVEKEEKLLAKKEEALLKSEKKILADAKAYDSKAPKPPKDKKPAPAKGGG